MDERDWRIPIEPRSKSKVTSLPLRYADVGYAQGPTSEHGGDSHLWDVWHLRKPAKYYERQATRFCSEFGMQSYSSPQIAATYCSPDRFNIQGPEMENHQKNAAGNEVIFDYVSKRDRFPKD